MKAAAILLGVLWGGLPGGVSPVSAEGVDWRPPWTEPHDPAAAAQSSDEYAWRLFVAVNWPAMTGARGPDGTRRLGADGPVVWETWQNANEVYLEDGRDPGPWRAHRDREVSLASARFESLSLKQFVRPRHAVNGVMVPLLDPPGAAKHLTEIRMNRQTFDYIRARELYNVDGQMRLYERGDEIAFPGGAKEIKASWRPIAETERSRYHTLEVTLEDGSRRLYGLAALHIATRDLPNWFWATFEHVDNPTLPEAEGWLLKSRDTFACKGTAADCNRVPARVGLEGTVWENYRLRGTLTGFTDAQGAPTLLANSQLERGFQTTSSCITCHSRSAIGVTGGEALRLPVFDASMHAPGRGGDGSGRVGYSGLPDPAWFGAGTAQPTFLQLDFVWSLSKAQPRK